ncbi:MAG: GNAT family N-acetyltransferase [Pseudonocardiales bacterium]|nr:GNAT family N-acetyltransferase [Pseudonocardiales bacterium]
MQESFNEATTSDCDQYTSEVLLQCNILASRAGRLCGLLSFKQIVRFDWLPSGHDYIYISTIAVLPEDRRAAVGRRLYTHLIDAYNYKYALLVRTWSTNEHHIALLAKLGFVEFHRDRDARGPGVDTVYFGLPATRSGVYSVVGSQ